VTEVLAYADRAATPLLWTSVVLALSMLCALVVERLAFGWQLLRNQRLERQYGPLVLRALDDDEGARSKLAAAPRRHRIAIATLLIVPLIDDRDPVRISRVRKAAQALPLTPLIDRNLRSRWWWQRALALRASGLMQARDHTADIVAALDDSHPDVRSAALDALSDLKDPASLPAIIVRLHDASLHRERRAQALAAFGSTCESFLLELAHFDPEHRLNYARALAICGTARSRLALCQWSADDRVNVQAAAFEALAHVGLDDEAARVALEALQSEHASVRAMAARALRHCDTGEAAARLGQHLGDEWPVAVEAARSLRSMRFAGLAVLQAQAPRSDLTGRLARQMLWEASYQ
jgi:HEAT repeat protein